MATFKRFKHITSQFSVSHIREFDSVAAVPITHPKNVRLQQNSDDPSMRNILFSIKKKHIYPQTHKPFSYGSCLSKGRDEFSVLSRKTSGPLYKFNAVYQK